MNLRSITIWTTKAMLVLTTFFPVYFAVLYSAGGVDDYLANASLWFGSAFPLIISFIIAKRLKHPISLNILLYSTIAYAIWYAYSLYEPLRNPLTYNRLGIEALDIFFVGFFSLPVMIPVWFAAVKMNLKYVKESCPQTQLPDAINKKATNLRITTIWTTRAILLLTTVAPAYYAHLAVFYPSPSAGAEFLGWAPFLWLGSAFPLFISLTIAKKLKHPIPLNILFHSTVAYAIWYIDALAHILREHLPGYVGMEVFIFFFVSLFSLPVMIPVWIAVLVLNRLYVKESCPQTQLSDAANKKASNLRRATIWTTGVLMIATMILPITWMWHGILHSFYEPVFMSFMMWCFTGSHLFVSLIITVQVKARISTIILLISAIVYGTVICCAWGWDFLYPRTNYDFFSAYSIEFIGVWSLTVMIPVWITALILNWRYAKN